MKDTDELLALRAEPDSDCADALTGAKLEEVEHKIAQL